MHRDVLGDAWYYADIDPPDHVLDTQSCDCLVWINVETMKMFTRKRSTDWTEYPSPMTLLPTTYQDDYLQAYKIRSVMGYDR
jgi:hypothetical protein